jgi:hypothetical protein
LVENNPASHFFIDEAPVSEENFPTEVLAQISKKVSPTNFFWIACQSDKPPYKENSILDGKLFRSFLNSFFDFGQLTSLQFLNHFPKSTLPFDGLQHMQQYQVRVFHKFCSEL